MGSRLRGAAALLICVLAFTGVIASPSLAAAYQPRADCYGVVAAIDVHRRSLAEAEVVLERIDGASLVEIERHAWARSLPAGTSLLEVPFSVALPPGQYRARIEATIFDALAVDHPTQAQRAAWPRAQILREAEVGDVFSCGGPEPLFDSTPPMDAHTGVTLAYDARARDALSPRFRLLAGPADAEVDEVTGALRWLPEARDLGVTAVILVVEDVARGRRRVQGFELYVSAP